MKADSRFRDRGCPRCGISDRSPVLELPARRFCASNWTYSKDYASILGIDPDATFAIVQCVGCGFSYAAKEPNSAFLAQVYDEVILVHGSGLDKEDSARMASRMRYVADLLELANPRERLAALDYGCGLGGTIKLLESAGIRCTGFEPSEVRARHLSHSRLTVFSDQEDLKATAPFDLIVCDNVLEHLPDPAKTIEILASMAAPGAVLYASVPDCGRRFLEEQRKVALGEGPLDMSVNPWEHLNYFDIEQLDFMFAQASFLPIAEQALSGSIDIGLRREKGLVSRLKNASATGIRLAKYALTGRALRSPNRSFYRFSG